jgi:GT2 family glycosyltransferase
MNGVGICTYNRSSYFKQCFTSAIDKLRNVVDVWCVYNDGSDQEVEKYDEILKEIESKYPFVKIFNPSVNGGVAKAKNTLLKYMMEQECDYLFLLEDDIIVKDEKAVTGYIEASEKSGFSHLCFAYHGPMNQGGPMYKDEWLEYHGACIGAWCMYTKEIIEKVGYIDENFKNAWEHVEFTKRIGDQGFCPPFGLFIDATGSKDWLEEIPGSIDKSAIRPRDDWQKNIDEGLEYWRKKDGVGLPKL